MQNKTIGKKIYLDNASTTPLDPKVLEVMLPYLKDNYGNPSSLHMFGRVSKNAIENSRNKISKIINCEPKEIIFTSGGTEANNLAIFGIARANKKHGKHIIVSSIEHKSILDACKILEKEGFEISYLDVDKNGLVLIEDLKNKIRSDTILVSVMYANNEIGSIQSIVKISKFLQELRIKNQESRIGVIPAQAGIQVDLDSRLRGNDNSKATSYKLQANSYPVFHTDACQATGSLPVDVQELCVDAMTISASKIYGPKGSGLLYVKNGIKIESVIFGGGQERGFRGGTENVASIVGLAEALEISEKKKEKENERVIALRDYFISEIKNKIKNVTINGGTKNRLPNNINISIRGVEGEALLLMLDDRGIYCSTGSACSSMNLEPSYVLLKIGLPLELAHCSIRFTLGRHTKKSDIDYTIKVLVSCVEKIRRMSSIVGDRTYSLE